MEKIIPIEKVKRTRVKNSSRDINFGDDYMTEVKIRTQDGGRIYFDKTYFAKFEVDEKKNLLRIIIRDKEK